MAEGTAADGVEVMEAEEEMEVGEEILAAVEVVVAATIEEVVEEGEATREEVVEGASRPEEGEGAGVRVEGGVDAPVEVEGDRLTKFVSPMDTACDTLNNSISLSCKYRSFYTLDLSSVI